MTMMHTIRRAWRAVLAPRGRGAAAKRYSAMLALAGSLLLPGCFSGDTPTPQADPQASAGELSVAVVKSPGQGFARLGTLTGADVEVTDIHSDAPFLYTTTDGKGRFTIDLGDRPLDALYKVQVRGGVDIDFDDSGTPGQAPVPNTATLTVVATGRQIKEQGVTVSVLTDAMARRVEEGMQWNPPELVMRELNEAAATMFITDINGDGVLDYLDVLAFNPEIAEHKQRLVFDYGVFFVKNTLGKSVMDMYHANDPQLTEALGALLDDTFDIHLPNEDAATLAALTFGVDGHGTLQTAVVPVVLNNDNGRYLQQVAKSPNLIQVRATAASGGKLLGWEGCTPDKTDPGLCWVTPDITKSVLAIFQDPDKAKSDTTLLHLTSASNPVGFVLRDGQAVITVPRTDALAAKLDSGLARIAANPSHNLFVGGDLAKQATVRVRSLLSRSEVDGVLRYVVTYASAVATDALESGSAYAPPQAISVDSIAALHLGQKDGTTTDILPQNEANADYVPGPNPVDPAIDAALCGGVKHQHLLVDGATACIADGNLPVQSAAGQVHACAPGETLVETLDGEQFCVAPADIHTRAAVQSLRSSQGSKALSMARVQAGTMSIQALQAPVLTSSQVAAFKPGQVVWLVGHGKAIHLSRNVFMVDRPDGKGVRMVTVDGAVTAVGETSRAPMAFQQCSRNANAPECVFFSTSQRSVIQRAGGGESSAQFNLLPPIELSLSPLKFPWVTFAFKTNVDLTGNVSASFNWGVLWYAFGSRGHIEVTPFFNASLTLDAAGAYKKPAAGTSPLLREEVDPAGKLSGAIPVIEEDLFKVDFLQKIPGVNTVSPVLESALRFSVGVDAGGQAKISIETSYKQVVNWDVRSEFTYYVFSSNHNLQSFKIATRGYPGASLKGEFNANVGLFARAVVSMGPRGILPELAMLQARYYPLKVEALGSMLLSYQTDPVKVAAQSGQNACFAGAVSLTLKESFDVTAKIDFRPSDPTLRRILDFLSLPKLEWTLYSIDNILMNVGTKRGTVVPEAVFGANVVVSGVSNQAAGDILTSNTELKCPSPSPADMPVDRVYRPGHFKMDSGHSVFTKTHEFTMEPSGDFAIYEWSGSRGRQVWRTGTSGTGGYNHVRFQPDGNLAVINILGDSVWHANTYLVGAHELRLTSQGTMEIWNDNTRVWSSPTGLNRAVPRHVQWKPGEFSLKAGHTVMNANRMFQLGGDGALALRRIEGLNIAPKGPTAWWNGLRVGPDAEVRFEADGNLVLYDAAGKVAWQSKTGGRGATRIILESDGRMTIYNDKTGTYLFAIGP